MEPMVRPSRRAGRSQSSAVRRRRTGLRRFSVGWRWLSLLLALALGGGAFYLFTDDTFIVRSIQIGGLRYVPAEEVFNETGIAGQSILMVDPDTVVERLEQMPSLDSAEVVQIEWPNLVVIQVREREPALIWEQDDNRYWVDLNGHLMVVRRDLPNLLRVVTEGEAIPFQCPGPRCAEQDAITIDPDIVRGAQHLKTLRSNIDVLYYDPVRGLSYLDGRGWRGYFGVGTDMDRKLIIYETLVANLESRGLRPLYIDVSHPDAPYYRLAE